MILAIVLAGLSTTTGVLLTRFTLARAGWGHRILQGIPVGLIVTGLLGYLLASLQRDLSPAVLQGVLLGLGVLDLTLLASMVQGQRQGAWSTGPSPAITPSEGFGGHRRFAVVSLGLLGLLLVRLSTSSLFAVQEHPEVPARSLFTGYASIAWDMNFHHGVTIGFLEGHNYPPQDPELAGAPLTYPYLMDFVAALYMRCGADYRQAILLQDLQLLASLVGGLYLLVLFLTRSRLAAAMAPWLFICNGGLGWCMLGHEAQWTWHGLVDALTHWQHFFTMGDDAYESGPPGLRFGNVMLSLSGQRGFLLALPVLFQVLLGWWDAVHDEGRTALRTLAGTGLLAGLLPLAHTATMTLILLAAPLVLLAWPRRARVLAFFAAWAVTALPQIWLLSQKTHVKTGRMVFWNPGWEMGSMDLFSFWTWNLGAFWLVLLVALALPARKVPGLGEARRFCAPFAFFFVVAHLLQFTPDPNNNVKLLIPWFAASVPLVALLLATWMERGRLVGALAGGLAVTMLLAGLLDLGVVMARPLQFAVLEDTMLCFASTVQRATPPGSIILHGPGRYSPVVAAGRRSLMGDRFGLESRAIDIGRLPLEIQAVYAGRPEGDEVLARHGVGFILVGPVERAGGVNEAALRRFPLVARGWGYELYAVRR